MMVRSFLSVHVALGESQTNEAQQQILPEWDGRNVECCIIKAQLFIVELV
jgi:hypothetical protein